MRRTWAKVFLSRVIRNLFRSKREETTEAFRKLSIEELYDLYPHQMIKSRMMRWAWHVE
jgi:hypothetical protein